MNTIWVLVVVIHLVWGGGDVKFQEFSSKEKCVDAQTLVSDSMIAIIGSSGFQVSCVEK